jgi:hypothetical protein
LAGALGRRYPGEVTDDQQLMVMFGVIHLIGLTFICALLWMFIRSDTVDGPGFEPDDDGGGGSRPPAPDSPRDRGLDGLPLPDAMPARRRLREPGRIGEERRERRPAREPDRTPVRTPHG